MSENEKSKEGHSRAEQPKNGCARWVDMVAHLFKESTGSAARDLEVHGQSVLVGEGTNNAHQ